MRATGATTYGSDDEWRAVIARTRAVSTYLAVAEQQLAAGVQARDTPDWRVLRDFGLQSSAADADYFAKTLPQIAAADIIPAHREALVRELQEAGNQAASAYRHLRDFVATTLLRRPAPGGECGAQARLSQLIASPSAPPSTTGRCATTCT